MIKVNVTCKGQEAQAFDYDGGDNLEQAIELFGAAPVYNLYRQKLVISLQGKVRGEVELLMSRDEDPLDFDEAWEQATANATTWKPGQVKPKQSKAEKSVGGIIELNDEEIASVESAKGMQPGELLAIRDQLRDSIGWTPSV